MEWRLRVYPVTPSRSNSWFSWLTVRLRGRATILSDAISPGSADFDRYRYERRKTVSDATVDHDFTYLKAALLLEFKKTPSRVTKVPHMQKSGEDNVRRGFLEFDGYLRLLDELPLSLKALFVIGYHVGNRKGALLNLKWSHVDFDNRVIRFIRMQNRKPVPVAAPIYGDMTEWLQMQKEFRDEHFKSCEFFFLVSGGLRNCSEVEEGSRRQTRHSRSSDPKLL
jgi:integrase